MRLFVQYYLLEMCGMQTLFRTANVSKPGRAMELVQESIQAISGKHS